MSYYLIYKNNLYVLKIIHTLVLFYNVFIKYFISFFFNYKLKFLIIFLNK